jgi:putative ABC transport system permease protein
MLTLIFHSIRMHIVQSIALILSIALASAAIASFAHIYLGAELGRVQAKERGGAQFMVIPEGSESLLSDEDLLFTGAPATMYLPETAFTKALELEGVTRATFQFFSQTLDASCCSATNPTRLIGIDPATDFVVAPLLPSASDMEALLAEGNIIIGSNVDGFERGSGEILGKSQQVSAVLAATGTDLDHSIIVSATVARKISAAQEGYDHFWERYGSADTLVSAILVDFDTSSLGHGVTATNKLQSLGDVKVLQRSKIIEQSAAGLSAMLTVLAGAGALIALASFLQLFARFYSMVWERKAEFALYEALGAGKRTLFALIGGEAGLLSCAGLLVGIALSPALTSLLLSLVSATAGSFAFIAPGVMQVLLIDGALIAVFVLLTLLSIIASLSRVTKIDPSLAMRQVDVG